MKHADNFDLFIKYADLCFSCLCRFYTIDM